MVGGLAVMVAVRKSAGNGLVLLDENSDGFGCGVIR